MTTMTVMLVSLLLATPVVISWLWLVILPYRVARFCPEECSCDVGGYFVDCSNKSVHNIPSIYLTHVQELVLDDNSITCLENDSFISKGLTELRVLFLDRCGLRTIEVGAFNGLTRLTILSMGKNGIGEITHGTFEMMSGLEYLGLVYNKIEHLDVDVFCGLINLHHVNFEGNELLLLHPDIFVGLPKLEILDLSENVGLQIPTDRHFINSHSLKLLDIYECNISSVSIETFANVSGLEALDLRYNNLRSIDIDILRSLPKLSVLPLYGNPLRCDCQLKEVWRWCQDHNIQTDFDEGYPVCYTLNEEDYVEWGVLDEIQCVQGNISNEIECKQELCKHPDEGNLKTYKKYEFGIAIILTLLFCFLTIFGITANVMLMTIITCNKDMRTVPNMYSLNLAISDTILLVFLIANFIEKLLSPLGIISEDFCTFRVYIAQFSTGLPGFSVTLLSMQRYKMIVSPFHDRVSSQPPWCVTVATICGVWIVAALYSIPSALSNLYCFDILMAKRNNALSKRVFTFDLMAFCVLPLSVTAFSYIMAARHLVKSADFMSEGTQNPQLKARKNIALFMLGLTVVFVISYVPFYAITFCLNSNSPGTFFHLHDFDDKNFKFGEVGVLSLCFLMTNSALNPVALFCTSLTFRTHLKRYLCCCCKANSPPIDIELQRRNRL